MVTIKDMAEMLGISSTTVSNVIHGKTSEVSQKTVEKVEKLLEELKAERSYSEQDAFLALKDILAGVWKSRQAQPPENT